MRLAGVYMCARAFARFTDDTAACDDGDDDDDDIPTEEGDRACLLSTEQWAAPLTCVMCVCGTVHRKVYDREVDGQKARKRERDRAGEAGTGFR